MHILCASLRPASFACTTTSHRLTLMSRRAEITTVFGSQVQFRQLSGTETLSDLYAFEVDLVCDSKTLDVKQPLGTNATVTLETEGLGNRYLDGIVTYFGMHGQDTGAKISYRMVLSPWLWLATRKRGFKIYQHLTVPQIVEQALAEFGYPMEFKLTRAYRERDFTVMYNETVYNFISRLCESEGIWFGYKHSVGSHTVVFCDDVVSSVEPLPGGDTIPFYPRDKSALAPKEHVFAWRMGQEIQPGKAYLDDLDFKRPRTDLAEMRKNPLGHGHSEHESFIWPGNYTAFTDGEVYTRLQLETDQSRQHRARAELTKRAIAPNYTIQLTNYPRGDQNKKFLVVSVTYLLQENVQSSIGVAGKPETQGMVEGGSIQKFSMEVHPVDIVYRPDLVTPLPRTYGPQTAVVVGPAGQEIWVDKYSRVKVHFQFDREGPMDENSSCWVRVSTTWAGPRMGHISIPRIGNCVLIDFLNGNPDYPVIIGSFYDGDNMPPWELPANATQSGIKTKSSKGGAFGDGLKNGPGDTNIINFEDKAGAELLTIHAQKDQLTEVENDENRWIGHDLNTVVDHDETRTVHHDRTTVIDNDETQTVHNNRKRRVDHNETLSVGENRVRDVGINETVSIGVNRKKSVGVNEIDSIGTKWGINVGKIKTESIGLFSMQNIGIANMQNIGVARMTNIGVAYNLNVGMVMMTTVGMNQSTTVGMNQSNIVGVNQDTTVGALQTVTVGADQTVTVGTNQTTTVGANQTLTAGANISTTAGAIATHTTGAAMNLLAGGMLLADGASVQVIGASNITLTCGGSSIVMTPGSITIVSGTVLINP
jgi:type VI secretion system secreted protein VgrG